MGESAFKFNYVLCQSYYLTPTHIQLFLKPIGKAIEFQAGQYIKVLYPNGKFMPFSIANAPTSDLQIELHVRVMPEDPITMEFIDNLLSTHKMTVEGPYGDCEFVDKPGPLLLIVAGTGFAPAKAIIEQLIVTDTQKECHLYWTVKQSSDFYLRDLPKAWQTLLKNFHFVAITTRESNNNPNQNALLNHLMADFTDFTSCSICVFGPPKLALETLTKLNQKGLSKGHFFTDVLTGDEISQALAVTN